MVFFFFFSCSKALWTVNPAAAVSIYLLLSSPWNQSQCQGLWGSWIIPPINYWNGNNEHKSSQVFYLFTVINSRKSMFCFEAVQQQRACVCVCVLIYLFSSTNTDTQSSWELKPSLNEAPFHFWVLFFFFFGGASVKDCDAAKWVKKNKKSRVIDCLTPAPHARPPHICHLMLSLCHFSTNSLELFWFPVPIPALL